MDKVYIITNPIPESNKSSLVTLSKFATILSEVSDKLIIMGGNLHEMPICDELKQKIETYTVHYERKGSYLKKILSFLSLQLQISKYIFNTIHKDEIVFFWIGDKMILPYIMAKYKRAQINYFLMGNVSKEGKKSIFKMISTMLIQFMAKHADYVCVESPSILNCWNLNNKKIKSRIIHLYVQDHKELDYQKKKNIVGMVCRLAEGKHVLEAITGFFNFAIEHPEWRLEIVGSGKLQKDCEELVSRLNANHIIKLYGWKNHDEIPGIIENWKLLLLPTDAEGLPNGLIESMILGVPAIASPVGGIVDVIKDNQNGWILNTISINSITSALEKATINPRFLEIARDAERTINERYTFQASVNNIKAQLRLGEDNK